MVASIPGWETETQCAGWHGQKIKQNNVTSSESQNIWPKNVVSKGTIYKGAVFVGPLLQSTKGEMV